MRKVVQLRGLLVQHHLIIEGDDVHLIDSGYIGGISRVKKALAQRGMSLSNIRSLLLTHGHLDHTLNAVSLQKLTNCKIYAPFRDRDHVAGRHRYRGWSRVCGCLEKAGRFFLCFQPPKVDQWFHPGDTIAGLEVVGLPGHTLGHCGFLLADEKLLFAGDLFTNHFGKASPPPVILNDDHTEAVKSITKVAGMNLEGIFLNHAWKMSPALALQSLQSLHWDSQTPPST